VKLELQLGDAWDGEYYDFNGTGTLVSVEEYLRTSFDPDCDLVEGEILERKVGNRRHSDAQGGIVSWFDQRRGLLKLPASGTSRAGWARTHKDSGCCRVRHSVSRRGSTYFAVVSLC
jgi:hypothetical protein